MYINGMEFMRFVRSGMEHWACSLHLLLRISTYEYLINIILDILLNIIWS